MVHIYHYLLSSLLHPDTAAFLTLGLSDWPDRQIGPFSTPFWFVLFLSSHLPLRLNLVASGFWAPLHKSFFFFLSRLVLIHTHTYIYFYTHETIQEFVKKFCQVSLPSSKNINCTIYNFYGVNLPISEYLHLVMKNNGE